MKTKKRTISRRQTQLDRIERKLDELLTRPNIVINPSPPGPWMGPAPCDPDKGNPNYEKAPWWMNQAVSPPTITCNAGGETK